jgi:hypothetical protein
MTMKLCFLASLVATFGALLVDASLFKPSALIKVGPNNEGGENESLLIRSQFDHVTKASPSNEKFRRLGGSEFLSAMEGRNLLESCSTSPVDCNPYTDTIYYGDCGGLREKIDGQWCDLSGFGPVCCGEDEQDCCELTGGGIAVVVIVIVAIVTIITVASCACCACCPWYEKLCCYKMKQARLEGATGVASAQAMPIETPSTMQAWADKK